MKLDRNINTDGRGRYALIHLRRATPQVGELVIVDRSAVTFGNEAPGEQFFVLKYKDRFAAAALEAYALALRDEVTLLDAHEQCWDNTDCADAVRERRMADELREFAAEIEEEARKARALGVKTPTPLRHEAK